MRSKLKKDVARFFDEFTEAFKSFDGSVIAERYFPSYIAMHADGKPECFTSTEEVAAYFQRYLDEYYSQGCRSCGYKALEVVPVGQGCALATVSWELYDAKGATLSEWRESYNLAYRDERLLVFASIDHAG